VARDERGDQRQQRAQVGREVDVHVTDHARRACQPGCAQCTAASFGAQVQNLDSVELGGELLRHLEGVVTACVVGYDDLPRQGELVRQELVKPLDRGAQRVLFVVDRHHDLDVQPRLGSRLRDDREGRCRHVLIVGVVRQTTVS
jgi:hypothetical protein